MQEFQKIYVKLDKIANNRFKNFKSYIKFTLYLHKSYKRFKENVGISKTLCRTCKSYVKFTSYLHKTYKRFKNQCRNLKKTYKRFANFINPM